MSFNLSNKEDNLSAMNHDISSQITANRSTFRPNFSTTVIASDPISITYFVICTCGILFNIFTIVVIVLYKPLRKQITNMLIANQCAIDAMASTFLIFSTALINKFVILRPGNLSDEANCRLWISQLPIWSMLTSSTYGIVSITFERFLAVVYPMWHKAYFTRQKAAALNIGVWLIGPCYYVPFGVIASGIADNGLCFTYTRYVGRTSGSINTVFLFVFAYIFPLSSMSYFYIRMNLALRRKLPQVAVNEINRSIEVKKEVKNETDAVGCKEDETRSISEKRKNKEQPGINNISVGEDPIHIATNSLKTTMHKATYGETSGMPTIQHQVLPKESLSTTRARRNIMKTMILVSVGFVLCWTCSEIYFVLTSFGVVVPDYTGVFYKFTIIMVFISTCINPVIYCAQYKMFQRGCKWLFCRNIVAPVRGATANDSGHVVTLTSNVGK